MDKKNLIKKYSPKKPTNLDALAVALFVGGMFIGLLAVKIVGEDNLAPYRGIIISIVTFLWGWVGVIVIKQRKLPGMVTIYGKPAIFFGGVAIVVFWSITIYLAIDTIRMIILPYVPPN
ncbi:MAG: hypothetical protein ACE5GO_04815 [Anaerolineales bacterium]